MDVDIWTLILINIIASIPVVFISVLAHIWVAYKKAPTLAIKGVKSWLQGEEGLSTLQKWIEKALVIKLGDSQQTITERLASEAISGITSYVRSTDGKQALEDAGKSLINQARSYLESEEAIDALEAIGSRTVDAAVGFLETDEGKAVVQRLMQPLLAQGAKVAAEGVSSVIGSYVGNAAKAIEGAVAEGAAAANPVAALIMESPGGKKLYKKYGPFIDMMIARRAAGGGSKGSPIGSNPYGG